MAVRPLNGLVAITECTSRFEADTAVARLAAAGIEAMVLADPAASVAPHLVTERPYSVLVRIAIADDAQQVLVRGGGAAAGPSPLAHPTLRPRQAPASPPRPPQPGPPAADDAAEPDLDRWPDHGEGSLQRPRWIKPVAWATAASVVLPLILSALRAVSQL